MFKFLCEVLGINKAIKYGATELIEIILAASTGACLVIGLIGAILYIYGSKRCKNVPMIVWAINLIIQIIGGAILNA